MSVVVIMNILCFNDLIPRARGPRGPRVRVSPWLATKMQDLIKGGVTKDFLKTRNSVSYFLRVGMGKMKRKNDCYLFLHRAVSSYREGQVEKQPHCGLSWRSRRQEELSLSRAGWDPRGANSKSAWRILRD